MEAPKLAVTMTDGNLTIPKGSWAKLLALAFAGQWVGAKEPGNERLGEKTSVLGFRLSQKRRTSPLGKNYSTHVRTLCAVATGKVFFPLRGPGTTR